ncbi:signal recognition particle-docking protein FtsY [Fructobacillus sp. M2-14]|uniref:Signal recognition particle receptor FtsY n=1 Tax=Fructobacillus broussonetiae TaxID=2713173 RepID=A0ABS5R3S2_9LACO|nr:signal recognition particle-docking protein FtsY [Fructobacillus broussonetiae]MBS9339209.1 signal recognition particle-docking protein FtsY [Fructobacillus broussonetiae]
MGLFDIFKKKQAVDNQEENVKQEESEVAEEFQTDDNPEAEEAVLGVEEAEADDKSGASLEDDEADSSAEEDDESSDDADEAGPSQTRAIADNLQSRDDVQAEVNRKADTDAVIESPVDADEDAKEAAEKGAEKADSEDGDAETDAGEEAGDDSESDEQAEESESQVYEKGLTKSRQGFSARFNKFLANFRSVDEDFFEELEDTLIGSDLGFDLAISISNQVREAVKLENIKDKKDIRDLIIRLMVEQYEEQGQDEDQSMHFAPKGEPTVILFVGVNGVGKTTTVGKMAQRYKDEGKKVMMVAADTFRAGAVKQLQEWGTRVAVPVVAGAEKADPASVVYEAVEKAKAEAADVLFVDTAGRLQNNVNLMQELAKMNRVIQKVLPEAPQEVLLVLDATTGQNALQQAKLFQDSSEVTGLVLTKMDGTAKGGIVFAIRDQLHLPVKWVGFGEKVSDLRTFSAEDFVYGMFKDLVE